MAKNESRRFGLIVIGDEILSGRRQDKHLAKMIELLSERIKFVMGPLCSG